MAYRTSARGADEPAEKYGPCPQSCTRQPSSRPCAALCVQCAVLCRAALCLLCRRWRLAHLPAPAHPAAAGGCRAAGAARGGAAGRAQRAQHQRGQGWVHWAPQAQQRPGPAGANVGSLGGGCHLESVPFAVACSWHGPLMAEARSMPGSAPYSAPVPICCSPAPAIHRPPRQCGAHGGHGAGCPAGHAARRAPLLRGRR